MGDNKPVIKIDHYNGIRLESYLDRNGDRVYGMVAMDAGQNDVWYPRYVFPSKYSKEGRGGVPDTSKKARPASLRLGTGKTEALANLAKIKEMLEVM